MRKKDYFSATRHPWSCLIFVLPLLAVYECGVLWMGAAQPEVLRNGADTWLRWGLNELGLRQPYWAPVLLAAFLIAWGWLRFGDRPDDLVGIWIGMTIESVIFAIGLWGISKGLGPLLDQLGVQLNDGPTLDPVYEQVVGFVGAGIYEEVLFRLLLYSGLIWLLRTADVSRLVAMLVAAITSAAAFSGAHHLGPYGESYNSYVFLFRTLAGVYFTAVYQVRGFGIAVGAHALYDVLVGVIVPSMLDPV
jgi:membrane protease YdiL (CAAX protease family)